MPLRAAACGAATVKSYPRQERIAQLLHRQLSQLIRRECRGEYLNEDVSISDIRVTRGGFDCIVYLSSYRGSSHLERALAEANGSIGRIHSFLGKRLRMKKIPSIKFCADDVLERGKRIEDLLRNADTSADQGHSPAHTPGFSEGGDF